MTIQCIKNEFEFKKELEEQNILTSKDITVAQYFEKWLEINCDQLSPTTHDAYSRYVNRYIIPLIGQLKMRDILQMHIQELINGFLETHRSKSANNLKGILSKAFNDAVENKIVKNNPCINIKIKRSKDYEYYIYSEDEFIKLLECVQGTVEEIPVILAALCGMRAGEVMGLMWENINFETKEITIVQNAVSIRRVTIVKEPKTRSSNRRIIAPNYVIEVLEKYKQEKGFVYSNKNGQVENSDAYRYRFAKILKKNNLPHTRFHDLRHFSATMMLKHGISDKEASARLGHSEINMTKKYQHILKSMESRAANIFDDIVTNGNQKGNQTSK